MARKKTLLSQTTPNHRMQLRSWLTELVMLRANKWSLPPHFWRLPKWKWTYTNEVKAISKFIKRYSDSTVAKIITSHQELTTASSYGELEFLLQNEIERLKQIASPKDTTPVKNEVQADLKDLREPRSFFSKKGLFEKLDILEDKKESDRI